MGILQSKKVKQKEKHPFNKDIKNGTAKEAAAKKATDFNHSEANDLTGNLNNTANTSQGLGPTQPSNGNEATLTRMHQVPAVDGPQNREQSIHKAVNVSQDADRVKYIPYLASAVRVTQQHTSHAKPKDIKTSTPKPMLQQATPARPTAGPCRVVKITAGEFDALRSDILQLLQDVPEKLSQQQSRPSAQVQQKTKPVQHRKKTTAPIQQQANREVMYGSTQHEESRNFTLSQQRPAAKETTEVPLQTVRNVAPCDMGMTATADSVHNSEVSASVQVAAQVLCKDTSRQVECSFGSKEQQEMILQLPASKMQAPVRRTYREVVRGLTTENQHSKETDAQKKAKINKSPSQKSNCVLSNVNEASADFTCHATDKAHNIAEQSTTTKPGIAEVPAAKATEPPDHSTVSNLSKAQVNNEENAPHKRSLNHNSVTNIIAVDYQHCFRAKSERSYANAAKMSLWQKLVKQLKAQPGDDRKSSQQTAKETVTTVQKSSQQQGCTAMEEHTIKKHSEPHQISNEADDDTNGNTSSCTQKVNVQALAPQVPVVEGMPAAAPNNVAPDTSVKLRLQRELKVFLPQDTAVKPKKKCTLKALNQNQPNNTRNVTMKEEMNGNGQVEKEKQEPGIAPEVPPEHKVCAEGRWHPFTVNQSCPRKVNPGTGLPPDVQKRSDECPNYLCEPPWVTTARLAAFLALRETQ